MKTYSIQEAMNLAVEHHAANRLAEAEAIYRRILEQQPGYPDALHMMGVLAGQVGKMELAVDLINQAIAIAPDRSSFHVNRGEFLRRLGRRQEAIASFTRAIALQTDSASAYNNMGIALCDEGRHDEAIAALNIALRLQPNYAEAMTNLGNVFKARGELAQAKAAYQKAISLHPNHADAHQNLGILLHESGEPREAAVFLQRAVALKPRDADFHNTLGLVLKDLGDLKQAQAEFQMAIELTPEHGNAWNNLGNVLYSLRRLDEAIAAFKRAIQIIPADPQPHSNIATPLRESGQLEEAIAACRAAIALKADFADAYVNLGHALHDQGHISESVTAFDEALRLKPESPEAHWNHSCIILLLGDFQRGWEEYEWRWKIKGGLTPIALPRPVWDGSSIHGKTLLIHPEQGFGDTIQFARYAALIRGHGGKVILACQNELFRLMQTCNGIDTALTFGMPLPPFDVHCPLLSLPRLLETTLQTIPASIPYLHADAKRAESWRQKLPTDGRLRIGLAWAGRPTHKNDRNRSIFLSQLAPLATGGVRFYSLQKGEAARQAEHAPPGMDLVDCDAALADFADAAALIANLDLIVTVDTAVAHLAGAMGKPAWVLLPHVPDWRWMLDREDSPWYPTMRLFRQSALGQWSDPIARMSEALRGKLSNKETQADE